jgi:hypothetical protein
MSRETWDDRTQILVNVLQARHGEELCASELAEVTGIKKAMCAERSQLMLISRHEFLAFRCNFA